MSADQRTYFLHASLETSRIAWRFGTFAAPYGLQTWHLWFDAPYHERVTVPALTGLFYGAVVDLAERTTRSE